MSSPGDLRMESESSICTDHQLLDNKRTVFVCGFVSKRFHNNSLQAVLQDLLCEYYVACNGDSWDEHSSTRSLLSNAEALIFFVNEYTLGDKNCLLILQYAWHLMVPIIMLRPPKTKLVICKREQTHDDIVCRDFVQIRPEIKIVFLYGSHPRFSVVANGSIVRSPSTRFTLLDDTNVNSVDYGLLQDVLHEGFKCSIIYDRLDHKSSMNKINERLKEIMRPSLLREAEQRPFFLSPANGPNLTERYDSSGEITTERGITATEPQQPELNLRLTQSMSNLKGDHRGPPRTPYPRGMNGMSKRRSIKIPPIHTNNESQEEEIAVVPNSASTTTGRPPSTFSRTSSRERRLSMGSLDDVNSFQETQYLVFPIKNTNKKPTLIKFPDDLMEDNDGEHDSIWGSDTSLEEESEIAKKINTGISLDYDEPDSPLGSPAPYIGDLDT